MKRVVQAITAIFVVAGSVASAHIMVSPPDAKVGVDQNYELRVHNEGKIATTSLDLEIPEGITVLNVPPPSSGTFKTSKTGDRITGITWTVEVPPSKYVALKFTARNPDAAKDVRWNVRQHLSDGSVVDWSDKPGAKEKASVTKIGTSVSAVEPKQSHSTSDPTDHQHSEPTDHQHNEPDDHQRPDDHHK